MPEAIVNEKDVQWMKLESLPGPGVEGKLLAVDRDTKAHSFLVKYEAGTVFPPHRHTCLEQVYILEGEVEYGGKVYGPGTHLIFPAGYEHGTFTNKVQLIELVMFEGMSGLEEMVPEIKELYKSKGML